MPLQLPKTGRGIPVTFGMASEQFMTSSSLPARASDILHGDEYTPCSAQLHGQVAAQCGE
jgi:hypothetical protein